MKWKVEYNNDVGSTDEEFWEWWEITNGAITFKANTEKEAYQLCDLLNKYWES